MYSEQRAYFVVEVWSAIDCGGLVERANGGEVVLLHVGKEGTVVEFELAELDEIARGLRCSLVEEVYDDVTH